MRVQCRSSKNNKNRCMPHECHMSRDCSRTKTCHNITTSPQPYNELETLSTLRFGARARNIKNAHKMNKEYSIPELKKMLANAEFKISTLEGKIKALVN